MNGNSRSWVFKAIFLGLVFAVSVLVIKPVGVSTQFSMIGGMIHSVIDPSVITEDSSRKSGYRSTNAYYDKSEGSLAKSIKNPLNFAMVFLLAIPLGGFIAWTLDPNKRKKTQQEALRQAGVKSAVEKYYIRELAGGFIFVFGARLADGCTSGHMMSGIMQGSVSGFVFAACAFAVAIPVAKSLKKLG
ncbi:MAG: YeeE/YedE thiosulfate transporter family protein [Synergistaceae bacterium]|nr:YeeE/YedE thiosulfate transporter family protein [Synergistaceae bacterium]